MAKNLKFSLILFTLHILCAILLGVFGRYGSDAQPPSANSTSTTSENSIKAIYTAFQDVQGMIFLGFGFLMTFLRRYGFSSVGLNMMLAVAIIEWSTLVNGFFHLENDQKFSIDINGMILSEFTTATILISFGALLGKCSPLQLLIVGIIETPLTLANEFVGRKYLKAVDAGDSIFVHAFGAYFGMACARALCKKSMTTSKKEGSIYHSDMFAMVGTLLLWVYWPSFNGGTATGDAQHRAVVNTFYSLVASTIMTFFVSSLCEEDGKFDMVHIQNATLAGGVAVGSCADLVIYPWGAILIGTIAGTVSTLGYVYITPFLNKHLFHDTCGVNNLHGMPSIIAVIFSAIFTAVASESSYGSSLHSIFPALAKGRSPGGQAGFQIAALVLTLVIAIIGGALTGLLLRLKIWDNLGKNDYFDDKRFWSVPPSEYYQVVEKTTERKSIQEEDVLMNDREAEM